MSVYHVYTDGACSGNPGPGGWAAIIIDENDNLLHELSGFEPNTTNNRMEIQAAISGIRQVLTSPQNPEIILYSDSNYLVQAYTKGWMTTWLRTNWKKGTVKNQDLWQELNSLLNQVKVQWVKVKGHSDNIYNNRCDHLAVGEIKNNFSNSHTPKESRTTGNSGIKTESSKTISSISSASEGSGVQITVEQVKIPPFHPVKLNNPLSKKPSENRCLVSLADLPFNVAKIRQVAERYAYNDITEVLAPETIGSITSSVGYATFNHPTTKVHPFFLQIGDMADFWLARNAERNEPYPVPSRSDLVKFICAFIAKTGVKKARELGLEKT